MHNTEVAIPKTIQGSPLLYKKYIIGRLRNGAIPKSVIHEVEEKFNLSESYSTQLVYETNKVLKESLKDLSEDAANYVLETVQNIVESSLEEGDKKSALKGIELLAKVTKLFDEKPQVTVNNYGFEFDTD